MELIKSTSAASVATADASLATKLCKDTAKYQAENNITL